MNETVISAESAVTQLRLLDGRQFHFHYNRFGELAEIVYPAGGVSQIDYQAYGSTICDGGGALNLQLNRRVTERRTLSDGVNVDATLTYTRGTGTIGSITYPAVTVEAHQGGISGALLMSEKHYFLALDAEYRTCSGLLGSNGTAFEKFENARELQVDRQTGGGSQIDARVWQQRANVVWSFDPSYANDPNHGQENPPNDPRVVTQDTTLENGKLKRERYDYDGFNNVTRVREYDFGQGAQGALLRDTLRTYLTSQNNYCYANLKGVDGGCGGAVYTIPGEAIHRRRLLLNETVKDGSGNVEAYSEYEYDNYVNEGAGGNHAPIQTNTGMIRYDGTLFTPFAVDKQPRGNLTQVKRLISGSPASGTYATSYSQYDEAGNVVKAIDPRGNATTISYSDNFGDGSNPDVGSGGVNGVTFAFATSATNALGHVAKTQYDYTRGVVTGIKDANGTNTRSEYGDPYDQPTRVTAAYGLTEATKTEMSYPSAGSNQTTISKQLDSTRWLAYKTIYDGFGRPLTANEAEDGNHASAASFTIFSKHIYDGLGRVKFATNPYRTASASTDGWTRTTYDLAGRVISVATFSGGPDSTPPEYPATTGTGVTWTGSVTTAYASEATTVTDQAGKVRRSIVDGLGRLVRLDEPDSSGSLDSGNPPQPVQPTSYSYDARGNLKTVTQGAQTRTFSYDLLSRLTRAASPESGTINYSYDVNSNLKTKLDARSITTAYEYDVVNRVTSRIYTSDPQNTPEVNYYYDSQALSAGAPAFTRGASAGRLVAVCYGGAAASAGSYTGYDVLGRVNGSVQQTDGQNYGFTYGYNLASEMTSQKYPSGKEIRTAYDDAGRLSDVKRYINDVFDKTYASQFSYAAHGAVAAMQFGNLKVEHTTFNSRLQPTLIGLGTSSSDSSLLRLDYGYGTTNNNGNVLTQKITAPGLTVNQCYGYDSLNRLVAAEERSGGTNCSGTQQWKQAFSYDRYGNRNFDVANTTSNVLGANPTVSQANNRFTTGQSYGYDNAGNLTSDPATSANGIVYDAENRQTQYTKSGQPINSYYYDGDGHRVKKIDNSGTTVFVYNAGGQLIAEYPSGPPTGSGTSYLTSDHLGSTRVVMKSDGSVARHDYLPFGEEISSTIGGRGSAAGYGAADATRQKFTQKERDSESGLDYFLARYYSSAQGRFTSPDEFNGGPVEFFAAAGSSNPTFYADLTNPQSLNKYQYCLNNPLRYIDPDGHDPDDGDNGVVSGAISFLKGVGSGAANVVVGTAKLVKDAVVGCASCVADTVVDQAKSIGSTLKADFDIVTRPKQAAEAISSAVKEGGTDKALNVLGNATGEVLASVAIAKGVKALGGAVKGEGLTTPGKYFGNLTKAETETALGNKLGAPRSVRPEAKTYYNPRTRRSFNVHEEPGHQGGKPHVDVRRRGSATERKYPLKEN